MHSNSALGRAEVGVKQQIINAATELYAGSLVIPSRTYHCTKCYYSSKRPLTHVIYDGQTVAPFKRNTHPFVRDTSNCPTVLIPIAAA